MQRSADLTNYTCSVFLETSSMAGLVMQAYGILVEVDILELSESPWPGVGIFHTSMGLGHQMVKELDLKLTLKMTER